MSLDTKHRPFNWDLVLGQEDIITMCRGWVSSGKGFHQSYLFVGPYGSGKTTLARILVRALLCASPVDGAPCDQCESCRSILEHGTSMGFTEIDAATNSGKADIQKILEEIQYDTFSGSRKIYLFDEAHQLSASALDALLIHMENEVYPGAGDKRLVCVFCTTEPEKMRPTIFSRCAPTMMIQTVSPGTIAKRLAEICKEENIPYEDGMLEVVASTTECHIRDALKAIEGLSLLGGVTKENVIKYLRLDMNDLYLQVLETVYRDWGLCTKAAKQLLEKVSPITCYEKLAELALLAYEVYLKAGTVPAYLDSNRVQKLGQELNHNLLGLAQKFSSRPGKPTASMLLCDLGSVFYGGSVVSLPQQVFVAPIAPPTGDSTPQEISGGAPSPAGQSVLIETPAASNIPVFSANNVNLSENSGTLTKVSKKDIDVRPLAGSVSDGTKRQASRASGPLEVTPEVFCQLLAAEVAGNGSKR